MKSANKCLNYLLNKHYKLNIEIPKKDLINFCDIIDFLNENTNLEFESSCYVGRKNNIKTEFVSKSQAIELKVLELFIEDDKKIEFKLQSKKSIEETLISNIILTKVLASTFFKNPDLDFTFYVLLLGKNYDKYIVTYYTEEEINVLNMARSNVIESILDYGSWIISLPRNKN